MHLRPHLRSSERRKTLKCADARRDVAGVSIVLVIMHVRPVDLPEQADLRACEV